MRIDIFFPVTGGSLPTDHSYPLYAALARAVPAFHDGASEMRFAPINGDRGGKGLIRLFERSRLRVRLPSEAIATVLPLTGRVLDIDGNPVRLGVPTVAQLRPAPNLAAALVTFKNALDPVKFLENVRRELDQLAIAGEPGIPLVRSGARAGEVRRRIIRVKGKRVVGFALQVTGLTAEESIRLQEAGLGGRRRMGCGFFVPLREKVS